MGLLAAAPLVAAKAWSWTDGAHERLPALEQLQRDRMEQLHPLLTSMTLPQVGKPSVLPNTYFLTVDCSPAWRCWKALLRSFWSGSACTPRNAGDCKQEPQLPLDTCAGLPGTHASEDERQTRRCFAGGRGDAVRHAANADPGAAGDSIMCQGHVCERHGRLNPQAGVAMLFDTLPTLILGLPATLGALTTVFGAVTRELDRHWGAPLPDSLPFALAVMVAATAAAASGSVITSSPSRCEEDVSHPFCTPWEAVLLEHAGLAALHLFNAAAAPLMLTRLCHRALLWSCVRSKLMSAACPHAMLRGCCDSFQALNCDPFWPQEIVETALSNADRYYRVMKPQGAEAAAHAFKNVARAWLGQRESSDELSGFLMAGQVGVFRQQEGLWSRISVLAGAKSRQASRWPSWVGVVGFACGLCRVVSRRVLMCHWIWESPCVGSL